MGFHFVLTYGVDDRSRFFSTECVLVRRSLCHLGTVKLAKAMPARRCSHNTKIHTIFEGTSEIQQLVISRAISGLRIE
jgi:alkylation response protein AidB-like acyl-CoA dehydrogenase